MIEILIIWFCAACFLLYVFIQSTKIEIAPKFGPVYSNLAEQAAYYDKIYGPVKTQELTPENLEKWRSGKS